MAPHGHSVSTSTSTFLLRPPGQPYASANPLLHPSAAGQLVELSFAQLEGDPLGTLRRVYETFGWGSPAFDAVRPLSLLLLH